MYLHFHFMYLRLLIWFLANGFIYAWSIFNGMQDHEQALLDAIARLGDLSDGESGTSMFSCYCIVCALSFPM